MNSFGYTDCLYIKGSYPGAHLLSIFPQYMVSTLPMNMMI